MHASINNCFFSPALTCSPLWRSRHIWKVWIYFDHGGLDQPMLGPSSHSSWHSLWCSNSYDESKSHFSCSLSNWNETEKVHSDFTSWNPKCLQYNWKKLDGGQCSGEKIREDYHASLRWDLFCLLLHLSHGALTVWPLAIPPNHLDSNTPPILFLRSSGMTWNKEKLEHGREKERGKVLKRKKMYKRKSETIKGKLKVCVLTRLIMRPPFTPLPPTSVFNAERRQGRVWYDGTLIFGVMMNCCRRATLEQGKDASDGRQEALHACPCLKMID